MADDHDQWRGIIARTLEAQHDVIGYAEAGEQILDLARELRPDVITVDISMPGQSGLNAVPALRAALPAVILVVVTTTTARIYRDDAFARGADGYVVKNRILLDLLPAVETARNQRSERRQRLA